MCPPIESVWLPQCNEARRVVYTLGVLVDTIGYIYFMIFQMGVLRHLQGEM